MKNDKRIVFLLSALLTVTSALLACGDNAADTAETQTNDITETETDTEALGLKTMFPNVDYNGETITILAAAEQWSRYYHIEKESGDVIDDAVYRRNRAVSEQLNVNFDFQIFYGYGNGTQDVANALRGEIMGGTNAYDLYTGLSAYCAALYLENFFCNLRDVESLDFDQPWWLGDINDLLTVDGALYLASGTLGMQYLDNARCIYFNKKLAKDLGITDIYRNVSEGTWTLDQFEAYGKAAYSDLNGDGVFDGSDRYGFAGAMCEGLESMFFGLGMENTKNNADGIPQFVGVTEGKENIFARLKPYVTNKQLYFATDEIDPIKELYPMFMSDQALFILYTLRSVTSRALSEMDDFGILPLPKLDETQEKYRTYGFQDVYGIPRGHIEENVIRNGMVLEALNFENYMTVYPAYKEIALERKYTRDEESAEMIDIIVDGMYMDFGMLFYSQLNTALLWLNPVVSGSETYSSWWAANEKALEQKLEKLLNAIAEFED